MSTLQKNVNEEGSVFAPCFVCLQVFMTITRATGTSKKAAVAQFPKAYIATANEAHTRILK
jgi:hypothetical protein